MGWRRRSPPPFCCGPRPRFPSQPAVTRRGAGGDCSRGTGRAPEWVGSCGAGRGREGGRRETRKTRFFFLISPERYQVAPRRRRLPLRPGGGGVRANRSPAHPGGGGGLPGPRPGRGCAGAVGARVAGPVRRAWGQGLRSPVQLRSVANRLHRSPPPPPRRGPSGGERPGVEWERVCARVCAQWRRLRPPPSRSRSLAAAGRPFACPHSLPSSSSSTTILRARVCDGSRSRRPPVGDGF